MINITIPQIFNANTEDGEDLITQVEELLFKLKKDAWEAVVEYYEVKDSHTLYECHLPSFVPLGASADEQLHTSLDKLFVAGCRCVGRSVWLHPLAF